MRLLVLALGVLALGALVLTGCATQATVDQASVDPASGLPAVALADLPPEARQTLDHIRSGGPFPYRQDGAIFENREGRLPTRESGYYREYTVPTPGADDRGARRIVLGADGEMYWTPDHYDSFAWIDP